MCNLQCESSVGAAEKRTQSGKPENAKQPFRISIDKSLFIEKQVWISTLKDFFYFYWKNFSTFCFVIIVLRSTITIQSRLKNIIHSNENWMKITLLCWNVCLSFIVSRERKRTWKFQSHTTNQKHQQNERTNVYRATITTENITELIKIKIARILVILISQSKFCSRFPNDFIYEAYLDLPLCLNDASSSWMELAARGRTCKDPNYVFRFFPRVAITVLLFM